MANIKISELPTGIPLTGVEVFPSVQSGATVKSSINQELEFSKRNMNFLMTLASSSYSTGTASQTGFSVSGAGVTFTSTMVGGLLFFSTGEFAQIRSVNSTSLLTVDVSQSVMSTTYVIYYGGIQFDQSGTLSSEYLISKLAKISTLTPILGAIALSSGSLQLPNLGLKLLDIDASNFLGIIPGSNLSQDRSLTINTGDSDRSLTLSGNSTITGTNTGDQNLFNQINVSGQSSIVADSTTDVLTMVGGTNISITTNASTDTLTINNLLSGNVQGPVSSTDNAVALFDGSTGNIIKDSSLIYDNSISSLSGFDQLQFASSTVYKPLFEAHASLPYLQLTDSGSAANIGILLTGNIQVGGSGSGGSIRFGTTTRFTDNGSGSVSLTYDTTPSDALLSSANIRTDTITNDLTSTVTLTNAVITDNSNNVAANSLKTNGSPVVVSASSPPATGYILRATSISTAEWQSDFLGDVTGPGSSTDSAISLFNGITGKIIKNSNITSNGNVLSFPTGNSGLSFVDTTMTNSCINSYNSSLSLVNPVFSVDKLGDLSWGSGNSAIDMTLGRIGTQTLQFTALSSSNFAFRLGVLGESIPRITLSGNSGILISNGVSGSQHQLSFLSTSTFQYSLGGGNGIFQVLNTLSTNNITSISGDLSISSVSTDIVFNNKSIKNAVIDDSSNTVSANKLYHDVDWDLPLTGSTHPTFGQVFAVNSGAAGLSFQNPPGSPIITVTGTSRTLGLVDIGTMQNSTSSSTCTYTIPTNASTAFPIGTEIIIFRGGQGGVLVSPASGVTLNTPSASFDGTNPMPATLICRYQRGLLKKTDTDTWMYQPISNIIPLTTVVPSANFTGGSMNVLVSRADGQVTMNLSSTATLTAASNNVQFLTPGGFTTIFAGFWPSKTTSQFLYADVNGSRTPVRIELTTTAFRIYKDINSTNYSSGDTLIISDQSVTYYRG